MYTAALKHAQKMFWKLELVLFDCPRSRDEHDDDMNNLFLLRKFAFGNSE